MNIWITSDTHYNHRNIAGKEISRWKSGYRSFRDVHQMNQALVTNINKFVKEDDILYHLGDFAFGGHKSVIEFRNSIVCKNIHLILGNHDEEIEDDLELQSLFTSVAHTHTGYIGRQRFHLAHYSHRVWPKSHRGSIHLFGHSHGNLSNFGKSMDVGIDVAYKLYNEYRPFHLAEILKLMSKVDISIVDHHR